MKGFEQFTDLFAMAIGMVGALMKGLKRKSKARAIAISIVVAGILTFSLIGVLEMFYNTLNPKVVRGISFVVGWVANELTEKIDEVFEELYDYIYNRIKKLLKK